MLPVPSHNHSALTFPLHPPDNFQLPAPATLLRLSLATARSLGCIVQVPENSCSLPPSSQSQGVVDKVPPPMGRPRCVLLAASQMSPARPNPVAQSTDLLDYMPFLPSCPSLSLLHSLLVSPGVASPAHYLYSYLWEGSQLRQHCASAQGPETEPRVHQGHSQPLESDRLRANAEQQRLLRGSKH